MILVVPAAGPPSGEHGVVAIYGRRAVQVQRGGLAATQQPPGRFEVELTGIRPGEAHW